VDAVAEARAATNRANAQKSTGPRTAEGRAISSQNSLKHGLYSKQLVVPGENPDELEQLKHDLVAEHQPGTPTEYMLVNEMAEHYWRLQRYRRIETALLADASTPVSLTAAHRFMNTAERGFYKALKTLRDLQKERAERSGARGFVPQESEALPAGPDEVDTSDAASVGFVPQKLQSEAAPSVCSLEPEIFADPNHPGLSRDREGAIRQAAN
jgi:hypothetical protein